MKARNVLFSSKPSLEKILLDNVLRCANEMCLIVDGVSEEENNQVGFGIYIDCEGNKCLLIIIGRRSEKNETI